MNGLNFQASVSNLTQMDRFQLDAHRTPGVNQEQNAQLARDEASQRVTMPVQPDEVDGKKIDPGQRKRHQARKKKSRKGDMRLGREESGGKDGCFIDIRI
jgi:hypothetical protein